MISRSLFWISTVKNGDVFVANVPHTSHADSTRTFTILLAMEGGVSLGLPLHRMSHCHMGSGGLGMNRASTMGDSVPHALVFSINHIGFPCPRLRSPRRTLRRGCCTAAPSCGIQGGDPFLAGVQSICFPGTPALLVGFIPADIPDPCLPCHEPDLSKEG